MQKRDTPDFSFRGTSVFWMDMERRATSPTHYCLDEPPERWHVLKKAAERREWLQRELRAELSRGLETASHRDALELAQLCFMCSKLILVCAFAFSLPSSGDML